MCTMQHFYAFCAPPYLIIETQISTRIKHDLQQYDMECNQFKTTHAIVVHFTTEDNPTFAKLPLKFKSRSANFD